MKRSLAMTATLAAAALALTACGGGGGASSGGDNASSGGKTEITFMGWGSTQEVAVFQDMIVQFEEQNPDIAVDYQPVPDSDYDTKLQTMIASNEIPDVFYLKPEKITSYADAGLLADLSDFTANNDIFDEDNIWPKAMDIYRYDGENRGQGAIYGYPKDISAFVMVYNKDLFDAAGITPPAPGEAWTWDQYEDAAKKLTSGEGSSKIYGSGQFSLESAVWSNGADWLNADHTKVTITDPKFVEALQWVADLGLVDGVVPTTEEEDALGSTQRFVNGQLAMMGMGSWSQGQFWEEANFNWDVMPWPVSPSTGKKATWFGSVGFSVSAASKHQEAADKLAAFLAFNKDAQQTNMDQGQAVPNLIDMAEGQYLQNGKAPENKQVFLDVIKDYGQLATQSYTYNDDWFTEFNADVPAVWLGEKTAQEFCDDMQPKLQDLLDEAIEESGK